MVERYREPESPRTPSGHARAWGMPPYRGARDMSCGKSVNSTGRLSTMVCRNGQGDCRRPNKSQCNRLPCRVAVAFRARRPDRRQVWWRKWSAGVEPSGSPFSTGGPRGLMRCADCRLAFLRRAYPRSSMLFADSGIQYSAPPRSRVARSDDRAVFTGHSVCNHPARFRSCSARGNCDCLPHICSE